MAVTAGDRADLCRIGKSLGGLGWEGVTGYLRGPYSGAGQACHTRQRTGGTGEWSARIDRVLALLGRLCTRHCAGLRAVRRGGDRHGNAGLTWTVIMVTPGYRGYLLSLSIPLPQRPLTLVLLRSSPLGTEATETLH